MLIAPGVGDRLRGERERLGLNQTDFGLAAGISRGTQKAYELGTSSPDIRYLSTLESIGVDVLYVITGQGATPSPDSLSPDEAQVLNSYRSMSEEDRASVRRLTAALAESSGRDGVKL